MPHVEAFPWSDVPSALSDEGRLARARRAAVKRFDLEALSPVLARLFAAELSGFGVSGVRVARDFTPDPWSVGLAFSDLAVVIRCQPELVAFALTRLLDRPLRLTDPNAVVAPAIVGAWHAIAFELSRVLARGEPPRLDAGKNLETSGPATLVQGWIRVDQRSYALELAILARGDDSLESHGDVPVTLRLVAAGATLLPDELLSLRGGDVLVLEASGITLEPSPGEFIAIAPTEERGFRLQVSDVVRYLGIESLPYETHMEPTSDDATKESVIATTPVVIRVEVGSVTLSAREWMSLKPGDVLSCGVPTRGPVVLRAAGREIARGDLVTVDGQVGVRIRELMFGTEDDTTPGPNPRGDEAR